MRDELGQFGISVTDLQKQLADPKVGLAGAMENVAVHHAEDGALSVCRGLVQPVQGRRTRCGRDDGLDGRENPSPSRKHSWSPAAA